jgi:hypothetical protein
MMKITQTVVAFDIFDDREEDPNGRVRIFGIGTKVRVPTGQIGTVTKIGRSKLGVTLPTLRGSPTRSYEARLLDIVK